MPDCGVPEFLKDVEYLPPMLEMVQETLRPVFPPPQSRPVPVPPVVPVRPIPVPPVRPIWIPSFPIIPIFIIPPEFQPYDPLHPGQEVA